MKTAKEGFTLIELLVVIAVIGLLLAILVPSLARAKEYAWRIICGNNLRSQSMGVIRYAEQNKGAVPLNEGGNWFQDLTFWSTNQISRHASIGRKSYFCPANKTRNPEDDQFWQFSYTPKGIDDTTLHEDVQKANFRVLSYIYMFDRLTSGTPKTSMYAGRSLLNGSKPSWITKITTLKNSGVTVMIADNTESNISALTTDYNTAPPGGCNFQEKAGGLYTSYQIYDTSNHFSRQADGSSPRRDVAGSNIGYADGHVIWKNRKEIKCQIQLGQYYWW